MADWVTTMNHSVPNPILRVIASSFAICAVLAVCAVAVEENKQRPRGRRDPHFKTLKFAQSLVKNRAVSEYVDISFEEVPRELQSQMHSYLATLIQWDAHPQRRGWPYKDGVPVFDKGGDFDVRVFAAYDKSQDDLIEYSWNAGGMPMRATSSRNAISLAFPLSEIDENVALDKYGDNRVERARGWLTTIFKLQGRDQYKQEYSIPVPCPDMLEDGAKWSSAPERRVNAVFIWHQRLDAYVENRVLFVLTYKMPPRLGGYQDGSKWFDDDFRALIHEKAREQGKEPPEQPNPEE